MNPRDPQTIAGRWCNPVALPNMSIEERARAAQHIADAFDVPMEVLSMSDREFHHWLHSTDEGRKVLDE